MYLPTGRVPSAAGRRAGETTVSCIPPPGACIPFFCVYPSFQRARAAPPNYHPSICNSLVSTDEPKSRLTHLHGAGRGARWARRTGGGLAASHAPDVHAGNTPGGGASASRPSALHASVLQPHRWFALTTYSPNYNHIALTSLGGEEHKPR